jgi:acetylornithine deacetylase/succinyl-diaminopimelate desuccinylase-like protein
VVNYLLLLGQKISNLNNSINPKMVKNKSCLWVLLCFWMIHLLSISGIAQNKWENEIHKILPQTLKKHREFVSIPNIAVNEEDILENLEWAKQEFEKQQFTVSLLESSTVPVFLAERAVSKKAKTILFYFHIDGQAINPMKWDQEDPFKPALKQEDERGNWQTIGWENIDGNIDPDWRIFGRAAADDKAPIMMMLTAIELLDRQKTKLNYNIKILIDPQEEAGSRALRSTLEQYKNNYAADYMIIMDGPAHPTNKPTLTFGFRGNASCSITVYGAKLPQHSGHYGNYAPNPIFTLSHLLASMKDENGNVIINGYYDGIEITPEINAFLSQVPDDEEAIKKGLGINSPDQVGNSYQESLQYPSLNVRHIETSWKGPGLKTVIPEVVTAYLDVRLVVETTGDSQLEKIKNHIEDQGYLVLDREPNDEERLANARIVKFIGNPGANAYRADMNSDFAIILQSSLEEEFGEPPVRIRTMGGTVPIISVIETLDVPTIIVPMVNMDNNQHNPNENIRIGNISKGIQICMGILSMKI